MIKSLNKLEVEGNYINIMKVIYENAIANIILNGETLQTFSLRSGTRQGCHFCHFYSTQYWILILVTQSCLTLFNPVDCSPPDSSVHGMVQARILEQVAVPFSRRSS